MQRRGEGLAIAATLALTALLAPAAQAQLPVPALGGDLPLDGPASGAPVLFFSVVSSLQLQSITATELLGSAGALRDAGVGRGATTAGLVADLGDPVAGLAPETTVVRDAAAIWEAWIHRNDLNGLQVEYRLTAANGGDARLSNLDSPGDEIPAVVTPLDPQVLLQQGAWNQARGGARLRLDLSEVTVAGRYRASMLVTLNSL